MKGRTRFEQDLRDRQRNIVFPDTVRNETRGYRELLNGSAPLTRVQSIGFAIQGVIYIPFGMLVMVGALFGPRFVLHETGSIVIAAVLGVPSVVMVGVGIMWSMLGWKMLRRSLG